MRKHLIKLVIGDHNLEIGRPHWMNFVIFDRIIMALTLNLNFNNFLWISFPSRRFVQWALERKQNEKKREREKKKGRNKILEEDANFYMNFFILYFFYLHNYSMIIFSYLYDFLFFFNKRSLLLIKGIRRKDVSTNLSK